MRTAGTYSVDILTMLIILASPVVVADESDTAHRTRLELHPGQHADGTPTVQWLNAARKFNDEESVQALSLVHRPFTDDENRWLDLIGSRLNEWEALTPTLQQPFGDIEPPALLGVLTGNIGARDAFVATDTVIAFDLSQLQKIYGPASEAVNSGRIDRFFAHEYTHVLHKIWRKERGLELKSPLERALWVCLTEGLGNYRSLSARWRQPDGSPSQHANHVLNRLAPIFVSRISALSTATDDQAAALMRGLSMGPFEDKWGALPVALWLAEEAKDDQNALAIWIERGPWGVLELANTHLPEELASRLPTKPD